MEDYKSLVAESDYRRKLLQEINKIEDYDNVPEVLYYEAVATKKFLEKQGTDEATQSVLELFTNMVNVDKLTGGGMQSLMKKKVRPKSVREEYMETGDIRVYLKGRAHSILLCFILFVFFMLPTEDYLPMTEGSILEKLDVIFTVFRMLCILIFSFYGIMFALDIAYMFIPAVRVMMSNPDVQDKYVASDARDMVTAEREASREVKDLWDRTKYYLELLKGTPVYDNLLKRFLEVEEKTHEYYDVCADIELEYYERNKDNELGNTVVHKIPDIDNEETKGEENSD